PPNIYALKMDVASFFDSGAFNVSFFSEGIDAELNVDKVSVGKKLFEDPVLSSNNRMACISCHVPERGFSDGLTKSKSFTGGNLRRNTPTLLYAGLQQNQFYDMRARFLEDQVRNVIESRDEIHSSLGDASQKLSQDSGYMQLFRAAFKSQQDAVSEWQIQGALSSYIRSLQPFNSKFDRFWRGKEELSKDERNGFNLFLGKARCGTCHFIPLFNGTRPPLFDNTEGEIIGVPGDKKATAKDRDLGRYEVHQLPEFKGAFKTPTLRNVEVTAPYMHNGLFDSLDEVINFYDAGGGAGMGLDIPNQTLPSDSLHLSTSEKKALIAFLKTLTDNQ
ncbi:MAG TPA: cytochrome c peroxidase, partial [Chitinophagaceae bacterium]|nr:cytochrome c peroxidase [Chitinophagaceae bacterium]